MNNLSNALLEKIEALQEEKEAIEDKIALLQELLADEGGVSAPKKKGRARKKKAAARKRVSAAVKDEVVEEASQMEGTDPEIAERLANRKFKPAARPVESYGPGVKAGTPEQIGKG